MGMERRGKRRRMVWTLAVACCTHTLPKTVDTPSTTYDYRGIEEEEEKEEEGEGEELDKSRMSARASSMPTSLSTITRLFILTQNLQIDFMTSSY